MVPYPTAGAILFHMRAEPVARGQEFFLALFLVRSQKKIVISQTPLRDCNRIVLKADVSVVIQQRNTCGIALPRIVGLLKKWHVIFAEFVDLSIGVDLRHIVPEGELALA